MTLERDEDLHNVDQRELDGDEAEVAEIRADIQETRVEMGGTLNELGERLEPAHLMDQAKENVRDATIGRVEDTAQGVSDMVMETIKRNPIPAAMAGAGLALLWKNKSSGNGNGHGRELRDRYDRMYGTTSGYDQFSRRGDDQGLGSRAGDTASGIGENVSGAAGQVGDRLGDVGQNVGQGVQQVGWRFERFMDSSPLAMGAIALGVGAVVGAVIPETQKEQEMLGDASRSVGETVRDTVTDAADKAETEMDKAQRTGVS